MTTVVLVCGGRDYARNKPDEQAHIREVLNSVHAHYGDMLLVHGGAGGADTWAGVWAEAKGVHVAVVRALWPVYGKGAGPVRNAAMLTLSPTVCVAFPGGKGTEHMKKIARAAGIPTYEV